MKTLESRAISVSTHNNRKLLAFSQTLLPEMFRLRVSRMTGHLEIVLVTMLMPLMLSILIILRCTATSMKSYQQLFLNISMLIVRDNPSLVSAWEVWVLSSAILRMVVNSAQFQLSLPYHTQQSVPGVRMPSPSISAQLRLVFNMTPLTWSSNTKDLRLLSSSI